MRIDFSITASVAADRCRQLAILIVLLAPAVGVAQLAPDPAFGNAGKVTTQISSFTDDGASALAVDGQGRVLVASRKAGGGISRHLADGSLDPTFGIQGVRRLDIYAADLLLQSDGKIVVVGTRQPGNGTTSDWQVVRLLGDGSVDSSFGSGGVLSVDWYGNDDVASSVALDAAGNIVVGGYAFVTGQGIAFALLAVDASGAILHQRTVKLLSNSADICKKVLVQQDGKIICAGLTRAFGNAAMAVVRYLPDYQLDPSFGTGGAATVVFDTGRAEANSAVLLSDGSIILGGYVGESDSNLALARLTSNGALDTTFGVGGRVVHSISGDLSETIEDMVQLQGDLFVTASTDETGKFALLRFHLNGVIDITFGSAGLALAGFNGNSDISESLTVHQGALLVGGFVGAVTNSELDNIGLAQFLPTGALDTSFNGTGLREISLRGPVKSSAVGAVRQSDGKIVAAGNVGVSIYDQNFSLARFLHDGSLDGSFGEQGMVVTDFLDRQDAPTAITVQTDGRLLVTGYVAVPPGNVKDIGVVRYTVAGALDSSFGVGGKVRLDVDGDVDIARAISVQVDGRILLAGDSTYPSLGSAQNLTLLRLMADGSRDTAFGTNGVANVSVATFDFGTALAVQSDGKILVGGRGIGDFSLARFTTTGVLDAAFGNNGKVTFDFAGQTDVLNALLIVPDWNAQGERILAVGSARSSSSSSSEAFAAVLLDPNGNPEPGFGNGGAVKVDLVPGQSDVATSAALLGDRLVLAGKVPSTTGLSVSFAMLGLTANGIPDPSFTVDGSATQVNFFSGNAQATAVVTSPQGEVTLVGWTTDPTQGTPRQGFALARFSDGDRIFSNGFEAF